MRFTTGIGSLLLIALVSVCVAAGNAPTPPVPTEAPTGFDTQTIDPTFVPQALHDQDLKTFEEVETERDNGLGPVYNAQSCRECHQTPVTGAASQVSELRVGHHAADGRFEPAEIPIDGGNEVIRGRTLVNDRAICDRAQERVPERENIRAFRLSLSTLGDGFIEAIADQTLVDLSKAQCSSYHAHKGHVCGQALKVPVVESSGTVAIGRFGWKDQHASLLSFAGDAYLNEMGVSNRIIKTEPTQLCVTFPKGMPNDKPDPGGTEEDSDRFARFMRSTKAPPRDTALAASEAGALGAKLFHKIGCEECHISKLVTAPAGTKVLGGSYVVPAALGDKIIHPYSDFLLHNVGTGDGIAIAVSEHYAVPRDALREAYSQSNQLKLLEYGSKQAVAEYAQRRQKVYEAVDKLMSREGFSYKAVDDGRDKLRTPPLWGLRTRSRLMHDGRSVRLEDAIQRHKMEAGATSAKFKALSKQDKDALLVFLGSL